MSWQQRHANTLRALDNPGALYTFSSEQLEQMLSHTIGVVQGKTPGAFGEKVADLRREMVATLNRRRALDVEEERAQQEQQPLEQRQDVTDVDFPWCTACHSYHHPKNPTCKRRDIDGGTKVPRSDIPPPKAPPGRLPEPEDAL